MEASPSSPAPHRPVVVNNAETAASEGLRTRAGTQRDSSSAHEVVILTPALATFQASGCDGSSVGDGKSLPRLGPLLTPTSLPPPPAILSTTGDPVFRVRDLLRLPTITIPSGISPPTGLPLGTQFAAPPFEEADVPGQSGRAHAVRPLTWRPPDLQASGQKLQHAPVVYLLTQMGPVPHWSNTRTDPQDSFAAAAWGRGKMQGPVPRHHGWD